MLTLALDVGTSSARAALVRRGKLVLGPTDRRYGPDDDPLRVALDARTVVTAAQRAIRDLGRQARRADCLAIATMSPSWVAMDAGGRAITPIVTHQDRRSIAQARQLNARVGPERFLRIAGNPPVPGGISITTWAWFRQHRPDLMRQADLVGHTSTLLIRRWTGARAVDPSHASFMGAFRTCDLSGWSDDICRAARLPLGLLPQVHPSDQIVGHLTPSAANELGLADGMPVLAGMVDTGAAMLLAGARIGQLVNVSGTTDVLALCTDRFVPRQGLLTRALGVGRKWLSVGTIAAAGSAIEWARRTLFGEMPRDEFYRWLRRFVARPLDGGGVACRPYFAGDRMSVEQPTADMAGLTLSTTRRHLLAAIVDRLARDSAARLDQLRGLGVPIRGGVLVSGGTQRGLGRALYRDWPRRFRLGVEFHATLRGLGMLADGGGG
jgi:xylulokinase